MLLGIKVIERILKGKEIASIATEHRDKGIIPHKDIAVVSRGDVTCNETRVVKWLTDILDAQLPGLPIHVNLCRVPFPIRHRKYLFSLFESTGLMLYLLSRSERILCHKRFHDISVFIWQLV